MSEETVPCFRCEGEGGSFGVYGQLDTYEECPACNGTGVAAVSVGGGGEEK